MRLVPFLAGAFALIALSAAAEARVVQHAPREGAVSWSAAGQRQCTFEPAEESGIESSTAPRATAAPAIFAVELSPIPVASRHRTGRDVLLAYRRLNI